MEPINDQIRNKVADPGAAVSLPNGWGTVELWYQGDGPPVGFVIHLSKKGVAALATDVIDRLKNAVGIMDSVNTQAAATGKGENARGPLHALAWVLLARLAIMENIAKKNGGRVDLYSPWFAWGMFWAWPPDPLVPDTKLKVAVYTKAKDGSDPGVWALSPRRWDVAHSPRGNRYDVEGAPALVTYPTTTLSCYFNPTGNNTQVMVINYDPRGSQPSGWQQPSATPITDAYSSVAAVYNPYREILVIAYLGPQERHSYRDRAMRFTWASQGSTELQDPRDAKSSDPLNPNLYAFSPPALAVINNGAAAVCCAQLGAGGGAPYAIGFSFLNWVNDKPIWTDFLPIPGLQSVSAPALAVTNPGTRQEQLHLICQGYDPKDPRNSPLCHCIYQTASGAWGTPTLLPHKYTSSTPALTVFDDKLYCVARGLGDIGLWCMWWDGQNWSEYALTGLTTDFSNSRYATTGFGPTLLAYEDRYGTGAELMCLYW
ncbi:hypothetical protein QZM99_14175 [Burkholderia gladioli]|uniref:hypothetical protein n=1 Tax=Burkholderia gladioli TaxID=28095 RepID=UPI00265433CF|nr:hypothetical protein [Burkholderia gladioli]MDN7919232.1 hypothetical protein [Burkholderia gladioli]